MSPDCACCDVPPPEDCLPVCGCEAIPDEQTVTVDGSEYTGGSEFVDGTWGPMALTGDGCMWTFPTTHSNPPTCERINQFSTPCDMNQDIVPQTVYVQFDLWCDEDAQQWILQISVSFGFPPPEPFGEQFACKTCVARYYKSAASWNCLGSNIMAGGAYYPTGGCEYDCTDAVWPATVTVNAV